MCVSGWGHVYVTKQLEIELVAEWGSGGVEWSKCQGPDITILYILQILEDPYYIIVCIVFYSYQMGHVLYVCISCSGTLYSTLRNDTRHFFSVVGQNKQDFNLKEGIKLCYSYQSKCRRKR